VFELTATSLLTSCFSPVCVCTIRKMQRYENLNTYIGHNEFGGILDLRDRSVLADGSGRLLREDV